MLPPTSTIADSIYIYDVPLYRVVENNLTQGGEINIVQFMTLQFPTFSMLSARDVRLARQMVNTHVDINNLELQLMLININGIN